MVPQTLLETMTPPGRDTEGGLGQEAAAGRSYHRDRYSYKRGGEEEYAADSHDAESKFWDSYGYNLRDNYGYGGGQDYRSHAGNYDYTGYSYPASERIFSGNGCRPGYQQAFDDPSFALGLFVVGAFATYLLYQQILVLFPAATGRRGVRSEAGGSQMFLDGLWSGKK